MLNSIGWRTGFVHHRLPKFGHRYAVQMFEPTDGGQRLPLKMHDGDGVSWMIPVDVWKDSNGDRSLVAKPFWFTRRSIRVEAHTSTGECVRSRVVSEVARILTGEG
jgi:hypothetical protein